MKLLFHCCCGPCAAGCIESLTADGVVPVLFWHNPNIHPLLEYQNRKDSLIAFAKNKSLQLEIIDETKPPIEKNAGKRCEICYRTRLEKTASYAAEHGFDTFSTSLFVSPYQQHDLIRSIGEKLAVQYGINFLYRDFRPFFRQGQAKARSLGLYMQKYCGCGIEAN